jgi:hypothetical protein
MAYQVQLPDGSLGWIDDSVPQSKALEVAKKAYPDAFPPPPGVISQLVSAPKEFVKGAASGIVQAVGGLGALPYAAARYAAPELKPFEETGFGKAITGAEQYLAPSDEGAVTQLAGGLGSFASIFGPQAILRGVGTTGRLATGIAPRAAAPVAVGQVSGLGVEEARQRASIARGEGVEVSPGEELAALATGVPIGLTELLPVERLFKGLGAGLDGAFKYNVANLVKRGFQQGGVEGAQEVASGLMQDLSAKGIYNPELEVGQSMLGEFALGAGVGAIAQTGLDVFLRKDIQRAYQGRLNKEAQDRINRETEALRLKNAEEVATTKKNLGIPETQPLALPAPAPKIEDTEQVDPLMNPVGFFNANELTPDYLKAVNNIRDKEGKTKLSQFSIEDLADAGAPQAEIDRLLTYKTGYNEQDQKIKLDAQDVFNLASEKNVDVTTPGFADFLRRSTGQADLNNMSQPQLFSAFKALDGLESSDVLRILPQGTNSTRFTQEQYDKTIKNIATLFPSTNLLGRSSVIKEIKDYSGLENDRDAESLLQTAIRKGDLATVSSPRYEVLDRTGKVVRVYNTRKSAEDAAARDGLSVREGTSINVALPGDATQLPGGPDIRKGTFQEGVAPAGFEIRSDDAVLSTSKDEKEASAKADRLQKVRESKALGFLGQAQKIENEIQKSNRKLESMEADGKADTLEYKKLAAKIANNNKNLQNQADRLKNQAKSYSQPLQVSARGEKPVGREGYTLFEAGKPVATFPNQQAAEEAALSRLDNETLQKIATLGRFQKGLMPKRLSAMARQEMERRSGEAPKGIGVEITGTRKEAEAKLTEAGVFTKDFQKAADELNKKLRPMMDKLGLGDLRLNILNAIKTKNGKTADGYYAQRLIAIALDAKNPIRTLRHEAVHALKELGAFTPEQWRVLENKAKSDWINKYDIRNRYAGQGLTEADMIEEAISDAFSDFDQTKPPSGMIGAIFRKIKQFMEAFGNGMRGAGFQTSDSVFKRVEEGSLAKIEAAPAKVGEEPPEETKEVPINTQTPGDTYSVKEASPEVLEEADRYFEANGILPYTEQTITSVDVEASPKKFSIKREGKYGNHDVLGIPVNKNGTVTLYFPADNESAREVMRSRKLLPAAGADRIYLTNESSEKVVLGNPGNIEQQVGGANVLVQIDPGMLQIDQEYEDGRIDFFIPVKEGKAFFDKMKLTKLFTLEGARNKGFNTDRTLNEVGDSINNSASAYMSMSGKEKREALKKAREILRVQHNIGTLLGENGKLEKTRVGDYGLTYEGQSVASLGLGLASAQSLNTQERVTTCPKSAICEGLCLGDTSGQNQLYGGEDEFRQGPRLSQYLKTEALMLNPDAFGVVLAHEIQSFANKTKQMDYQPAIRLNVTSDIPPKVYKGIIDLFPNVMFYDYTKLYGNDSIAPNHHITYSSSGISQVVNGELIVNKFSTWDKDVKKLLSGKNVAMAFTSRNDIPNFVIDEKTGNKFEVWNGDNYDARFLDPKRDDGVGYIIGLTNKDRTTKPEEAAKKHGGFFFDYDAKRDGDTLVVQDQSKLNQGKEQPIKFLPQNKVQIGDRKYSLRQTDTPEFKQWFGKSQIKTLRGEPKRMYHGTARDISEFRPKQANAIFLTEQPSFANAFSEGSEYYMIKELFNEATPEQRNAWMTEAARRSLEDGSITQAKFNELEREHSQISFTFGLIPSEIEVEIMDVLKKNLPSNQNIMPLYVRAENPFDYDNPEHVKVVTEKLNESTDSFGRKRGDMEKSSMATGNWETIENPLVQEAIRDLGFDSFYVREGGIKNLAVYDPNQIKSAIGNIGTFSREDKDIRFSLRDTIDPAIAQSIDRTTTVRKEQGLGERMAEAVSPTAFQRFRQGMINKYESIERLSQDVAKQFGSNELLADTSAIAAALFSDRAAGVAASSFRNGVPVYNKGFTSVSDLNGQVKGLIPILEPLAKYGDPYVFQAFQFYAATKRGKRLTAEGREKLFTPAEIQQGSLLEQQYPEFKQVFDEYQKYNKGLVDFMRDTGVLSEEEAKIWTQNWDYIPFYRQMDGEEVAGPRVFSAIAGVAKPKKLKGGEAPLADFMETVVRNSRAAIEAGMKNVAMQRVVRDVMRLNQGEFVPAPLAKGADIVTVKENGKTKHYRVDDPLLVQALHGLNLPQLPFLEILAKPAEVLRNLVTKDPGFMLANLMRDSLQAWTTTGTNIIPIVDTFKQYGQALADASPEARALANGGLFAGYDFGGDVKSTAREVEAELRKRSGQRTAFETATLPLSKMWELLDKGSSVSDVATRAEVYKRTLEETGNEAEALYQAMEVLNFSRKGNSALIRILTAVVPFMNARIQGLDVLYRAGFGKMATATKERQQKAFVTRGLTLFALSSMYWMMASDTEEYKTAEPEVRDNNWIIGNVRIPIPFEIGTVFKVFPERIYEYFFGMDTGRDLKDSIVRNITSTLAFNPIPQAILPVVENVVNYSFFTGQPIVGKGMQDVAKQFQATPGTSLLAQQIADSTGQSPIMIDNLIRGYTGTIGTYAVMALDSIMRGEGDPTKATMKAEQMPVIKRFFASPESTGSVTAYYDLKNRVDEAVRTINFLERTGGIQDLQEYMKDKGAKLISIQPYIQTLDKEITMLREFRRAVNLSQMEPDRKRQTLDSIRTAEVQMTSRIQYLKKMVD